MLNELVKDPLFVASEPAATLRSKPLGFIDVGTRGGVHELVEPLAGLTAVLAFEPDQEECRQLQAEVKANPLWASCAIEPVAIAAKDGQADFNVYTSSVNSSLGRIPLLRIRPAALIHDTSRGYPLECLSHL